MPIRHAPALSSLGAQSKAQHSKETFISWRSFLRLHCSWGAPATAIVRREVARVIPSRMPHSATAGQIHPQDTLVWMATGRPGPMVRACPFGMEDVPGTWRCHLTSLHRGGKRRAWIRQLRSMGSNRSMLRPLHSETQLRGSFRGNIRAQELDEMNSTSVCNGLGGIQAPVDARRSC